MLDALEMYANYSKIWDKKENCESLIEILRSDVFWVLYFEISLPTVVAKKLTERIRYPFIEERNLSKK